MASYGYGEDLAAGQAKSPEVIVDVTVFVDPVLDTALDIDASWDPATRRW